jgi:hypothetical protein
MRKDGEEIMELAHEPAPGYRKIFYVVMTAATIYFAVILYYTL